MIKRGKWIKWSNFWGGRFFGYVLSLLKPQILTNLNNLYGLDDLYQFDMLTLFNTLLNHQWWNTASQLIQPLFDSSFGSSFSSSFFFDSFSDFFCHWSTFKYRAISSPEGTWQKIGDEMKWNEMKYERKRKKKAKAASNQPASNIFPNKESVAQEDSLHNHMNHFISYPSTVWGGDINYPSLLPLPMNSAGRTRPHSVVYAGLFQQSA